jgi:hypothetical protein
MGLLLLILAGLEMAMRKPCSVCTSSYCTVHAMLPPALPGVMASVESSTGPGRSGARVGSWELGVGSWACEAMVECGMAAEA